jgi:transcriptional repressor NrdR
MKCPHCAGFDSRVVDTRSAGDGIRRRRECKCCGQRFTTYEQVATALHIVKSDGRREPYDRQKLLDGIRLACAKRPIAMADIERIVDQVEEYGKLLELLKELDEVGYIRFATVYLELTDLGAVKDEIDRLLKET